MERKFIFFIVLFLIVGCDDKLAWIKTPSTTPIVYSITPNTGTAGTAVKVSGTNFSATLSKNEITINGTSATITEASTSTLTFIAPNETTGAVLITVNNKHAENRPVFTYQ